MARFTKRQLITGVSVVYLALLTALAAYALHRSNTLSLPIPNVLSACTVALPPLAGIALESLISFRDQLASRGKLQYSKLFQSITAFFLIYETVIATLAGTHLAPVGGLWCPLQDRWKDLFRAKDSAGIKAIQDALQCCGFASVRDMAWPFPDNRGHGSDACMVRFERDRACLEPWRDEERRVAIVLLVVPLAVFAWKVALFVVPGFETPWLPSALRLPIENSGSGSNISRQPRAAILYRDLEESGEADSLRDEINQLNNDSSLATHVETGRVRPSPLIQEQENGWTRD